MTQNRERLAWFILITSFTLCVALAVGVPLGIRQFLLTATRGQDILLQPLEGTPGMQRGGRGDFIALRNPTWDVPAGSVITTDDAAQVLLTFYVPNSETDILATVQVYGNSQLRLVSARSPMFGISPLSHRLILVVESGRVRVTLSPAAGRETTALLRTPHLSAELNTGSYEVRAYSALTEFTVREGGAEVVGETGQSVTLTGAQRTIAQSGNLPLEVLPAARNLLSNGDFRRPVEEGWEVYFYEAGTVQTTTDAGRPAARFFREGVGHAEVGIRQQLNYDVRDFTSLILHLSVQVRNQSLNGCGMAGSECPIIVRIDYRDVHGGDKVWYHGFYGVPPAANDYLYWWSELIPLQAWVTYDSENLMASDPPPALIKSVTIYASGHTFDALVAEVELLAQE